MKHEAELRAEAKMNGEAAPPGIGHNRPPEAIPDDQLTGAREIAAFLGVTEKRAFYLCAKGLIPCGKLGMNWIASRRVLRADYDRVTRGVA